MIIFAFDTQIKYLVTDSSVDQFNPHIDAALTLLR